jgi:transcriptional regulator with XRE-family HTH domain
MSKVAEKKRAEVLRKQGFSYSYISNELDVSKSTLSYWLRDIPFIPNKKTIQKVGRARLKSGIYKSREKIKSIAEAKSLAVHDVGYMNNRDLFLLGVGLYIGEGSKTQNSVRIVNSDPRVIMLAVKWFKSICGLKTRNFKLAIHLYPDNNIERSLNFWSNAAGIPKNQFGKTQIDRRKKTKRKSKTLSNGTAHLTVKSLGDKHLGSFLSRRIEGWMEEVFRQTNRRV